MPWFITAVIGPETLKRMPEYKHCNTHTYGFYNEYKDAYAAIKANRSGMDECLFDYLVVEYMEQGMRADALIEEWWIWSICEWDKLPEKPKDTYFQCSNWAMG